NGGPGGNGGTLTIFLGSTYTNRATITLTGGEGGTNGVGLAAAEAKGGEGGSGSPKGADGANSGALGKGAKGAAGKDGFFDLRVEGQDWFVSGPPGCVSRFTDSNSVTRVGWRLCGGVCLSRFVNTGVADPLELRFDYRWLSTVGTLQFSL